MGAVDSAIRLGQELEQARNAAFDLWSWLPSYQAAVRHHGDYAGEFVPSLADAMREAAEYISDGLDPDLSDVAFDSLYACPCGEDFGGGQEDSGEDESGEEAS